MTLELFCSPLFSSEQSQSGGAEEKGGDAIELEGSIKIGRGREARDDSFSQGNVELGYPSKDV